MKNYYAASTQITRPRRTRQISLNYVGFLIIWDQRKYSILKILKKFFIWFWRQNCCPLNINAWPQKNYWIYRAKKRPNIKGISNKMAAFCNCWQRLPNPFSFKALEMKEHHKGSWHLNVISLNIILIQARKIYCNNLSSYSQYFLIGIPAYLSCIIK